jgi:hypothetical protein
MLDGTSNVRSESNYFQLSPMAASWTSFTSTRVGSWGSRSRSPCGGSNFGAASGTSEENLIADRRAASDR